MKILFLTRRAYPHIGGVEKHILKISEKLAGRGHEVTVLAENHDPKNVRDFRFHDIDFRFFSCGPDGFFKKFHIWWWMLRNVDVFLRADVIHIHDIFVWYLPLRIILFWKPVFTTFHGYEGVCPPAKKAVFLRRLGEFLSKKTIDVGSYLGKWYGTRPDAVIYGGVDNVEFSPSKSKHLILVGRLEKDISIELYIELLKNLKNYTVDIYGDGSYRKVLQKYGIVHGFVESPEKYMKHAEIVCASSYLTMLEALSLGKRVVALYDNPLKKDYLEDTPFAQWLYISDNPKKLPQFRKFSQSERTALESYMKSITWDHVVDAYERLWHK